MGQFGRCIVCHADGHGRNNFLCTNCFTLATFGPLFACKKCGYQPSVSQAAIVAMEQSLGMKINKPGHIIIMTFCATCNNQTVPPATIQFELHQVTALRQ